MSKTNFSRLLGQRLLPIVLAGCGTSAMAVPVAVDLSVGWSAHNSTGGTTGW